MKGTILMLLAAFGLLLAAASLEAAAAEPGAPATGLRPGTWVGTGRLNGSIATGEAAVAFAGPLRFTLRVDERLRVSGSGSWRLGRLGNANVGAVGPTVGAQVKGWAALAFLGTSRRVSVSGTQYVIGEVSHDAAWPLRFEQEVDTLLRITKSGPCRVAGIASVGPSSRLSWSAELRSPACDS